MKQETKNKLSFAAFAILLLTIYAGLILSFSRIVPVAVESLIKQEIEMCLAIGECRE